MTAFATKAQLTGSSYESNRADMLGAIEELRILEGRALAQSEKRRARFTERGQLTPRERLARLLDPGSPFLELHSLAGYLIDGEEPRTSIPGASVIAGIGFVSGVRSMIVVDDSGINAGAITEMSVDKLLSCFDIALRQCLPLIHLVESAGANLMRYRVELWARGGGLFYRLAKLSAAGIPTMVVLHGPSTAGGAYMPGMSDYVVAVRGRGRAALGGAALVKAATGEVAREEDLSGASMHATTTGLVEYLADNDAAALGMARDVIARLGWNRERSALREAYLPPRHDSQALLGIVPIDYRQSYDCREVLARVVDDSSMLEFKPAFGPATVCIQASVFGIPCYFLANNGPIDPAGANKATHFIQLADQANCPLVFLNNITGYMVGLRSEQAGMIKHGAKMIQAVSNARVPRISFYIGASFGAGNYGMCGYAYQPDFLFAWPNASTGVMGGEQAARTMTQVTEQAAARRGESLDAQLLAAREEELKMHFDAQTSAFYTSGRLLDHGVIDPRDTRKVLGMALQTCLEGRARNLSPNSFGVARI
jgi:geranyl-CoA carboxylase beta subunit